MQMLSNILPGIREVRAPFVAGFITLVALYLILDERIAILTGPSADNSIEAVRRLLGKSGRLAVAGIVTYLVGALIMQAMKQIKYRTAYRLDSWVSKKYNISEYARKPRKDWSAMARLVIPFSRTSLARLLSKCDSDRDLTNVVQFEIRRSGGKRLLVANKDLYLEYDRLQAEADLRRARCLARARFAGGADWQLLVVAPVGNLNWHHYRLDNSTWSRLRRPSDKSRS
jgi:hypothetical protein